MRWREAKEKTRRAPPSSMRVGHDLGASDLGRKVTLKLIFVTTRAARQPKTTPPAGCYTNHAVPQKKGTESEAPTPSLPETVQVYYFLLFS